MYDISENRYWIPELPQAMTDGFEMLNKQYAQIYREQTKRMF